MKIHGVSLAAIAVALSAPVLAHAAEPASVGEVTVTAAARDINLTTSSTAGSRLNLTPLETPASVANVSGDLIRSLGIDSISQASTLAPGVSQVPFPGTGNNSVSARGFYGVNSITQTYDGMQLFNGGGVIAFPFDTWNVERIEVLNGPASVLYGAGAIGGAVNVVSKKPNTREWLNQVQASLGTFDTYQLAMDSTGPINDRLAYRLNVSHRASQGWVDDGESKSVAISAALRYAFSDKLAVSLVDDYGNIYPSSYEGTPTLNGKVMRDLRFKNYNVQDARINFNENRLRANIDWRPTENLSFQNDTYIITHARKYFETYTYAYLPATNQVRRTTFRDIDGFQTQIGSHGFATLNSDWGSVKNSLVVGYDVNKGVYDRRDNAGGGSFPGTNTLNNAYNFDMGYYSVAGVGFAKPVYEITIKQRGFFAQDRLQLTDKLSLVGGVRADHYTSERIDHITRTQQEGSFNGAGWNVGVVYMPTPGLSLYAQYATAKDPVTSLASIGASQLAFNLSPGRQYEAGVKQSAFDGKLEWTLAAYKIVKEDLISPSQANAAISEQVGQQSSKGVEASVSLRVTPTLQIDANGTVLDAQFDDFFATVGGRRTQLAGKIPQFVPEKTANLRAMWNFLPKWQARMSWQYVDTRWSDNPNTFKLPAYGLYNLGLRWNATRKVSVDARVDNVTNKVYVISTYAGVGSSYILGQPRTFTATLNMAF